MKYIDICTGIINGMHISMASGPNHSSLDRQILQNDDKNDKTH